MLHCGKRSATLRRYADVQRFLFLLLVLYPWRMRGKRSHTHEQPSQTTAAAEKPGGFLFLTIPFFTQRHT